MMKSIILSLLVAVVGCNAQYGSNSADLKERNREVSRNYQSDANSNRRVQKREEVDSSSMYHNCFVSKGCFGYPSGCIPRRDCEVLLSFVNSDGGINFMMNGYLEADTYMAMGISTDNIMGEDAVTECFREGSKITVRESWNKGKSNELTTALPNNLYYGEFKNGLTTCAWAESYLKEFNGRRFNLQNSTYYLLLAKGPMRNGGIGYHSGRLASQEAVNFTAFDTISGEGITDSVKIHGSSAEADSSEFTKMFTEGHEHTDSPTEKAASFASKITFNFAVAMAVLAAVVKFSTSLKP